MDIQLYQKLQDPLDAIDRVGEFIAKSGMFGCTRIEQGKVLAMICFTTNMTPDEVCARYHIIDGQLSKKALSALADFRKKGGKHRWTNPGFDGKKATGEFTFEGQTLEVTFTIEDATRQGLVRPNSNWVKTPANMLRARVISTAIGMLAPEIYSGGKEDEEDTQLQPAVRLNFPPPVMTADPSAVEAATPAKTSVTVDVVDLRPAPAKEEQLQAEMGLAPAIPPVPTTPTKKKAIKPSLLEKYLDGEEPMPPVTEIGPDSGEAQDPPAEAPREEPVAAPVKVGPIKLDQETIEQIGRTIDGHFVEVAQWMIKQGWIEPSEKELKTESQAAVHLQRTLPFLSKGRARKILSKGGLGFMRPVEEIAP